MSTLNRIKCILFYFQDGVGCKHFTIFLTFVQKSSGRGWGWEVGVGTVRLKFTFMCVNLRVRKMCFKKCPPPFPGKLLGKVYQILNALRIILPPTLKIYVWLSNHRNGILIWNSIMYLCNIHFDIILDRSRCMTWIGHKQVCFTN